MKLGINTYTYMWSIGFQFGDRQAQPARPLSALDLLCKARDLSLRVVQIGPNLPLDKLSEADLDAFVRQAHTWGIELELGTRGLETDHLLRQLALAKRIGARLLRTIPEIDGKPVAAQEIPGYLRAVLPSLEANASVIALENGNLPAARLRWAIEEVGSPRIGVVLDMVNSLAVSEGWQQVTEALAPHTMCLHLKDFAVMRAWNMMGFVIEGRPAGKGQVDLPWLFDTLRASRYDFNVIIELWPPEQPTLEESIALEQAWAVESVSALRVHVKD
ncbi:MAG: sugar phosphate isomerase/epimerase [Anaerolineae bacterium]|jgi:sugar phosphate isomerase/epimerase|nr:sugar phosphate isomerase/epimerase [Anaerolineae bacterium]